MTYVLTKCRPTFEFYRITFTFYRPTSKFYRHPPFKEQKKILHSKIKLHIFQQMSSSAHSSDKQKNQRIAFNDPPIQLLLVLHRYALHLKRWTVHLPYVF